MSHVVLLGDSIFDNASYVPDRPAVAEQVRRALPVGWKVTLLATDGHTTADVIAQLRSLPADASHLFVSAGGNDALLAGWILGESVPTVQQALQLLEHERNQFQTNYREMLKAVLAAGKKTTVCTVYDHVPGLEPAQRAALAGFNEIILREAIAARVSVIDLRLLCQDASDYSHVSEIEPSAVGGFKIARVISEIALTETLDDRICAIFA